MSRGSEIGLGLSLVTIAVLWLLGGWFMAIVGPDDSTSLSVIVGLLVAIALGAAVLALGFAFIGARWAGWSLVGFGVLWAGFWALLLSEEFPEETYRTGRELTGGNMLLGLVALAAGIMLLAWPSRRAKGDAG